VGILNIQKMQLEIELISNRKKLPNTTNQSNKA